MKRALKFLALALGLVGLSYLIAGATIAFEVKGIITDSRTLVNEIKSGDNQGGQKYIAGYISARIRNITKDLNDPMWRPIVNRFTKHLNDESQLLQALISTSPDLLGADAPKKYLIAFQNSAEARGTGGIIGAFAEIQIYHGKITTLREGSNLQLKNYKYLSDINLVMPKEFSALWGNDPAIWQNANASPHFPYAAQVMSALWRTQYHENLDGVAATDPIALSYVLKAIGPVTLPDGEIIDSSNVVAKTLSDSYARFATDNLARKEYLVSVMKAVLQKLIDGQYSKRSLLKELETPLLTNRVFFYLLTPANQQLIEPTVVGGSLDTNPENNFRAIIVNTAGNKLDYYIKKKIIISSLSCKPTKNTRITVTVTNTLKEASGLTDYVKGRLDLNLPHGKNGSQGILLMIYGPANSKIISSTSSNPEFASSTAQVERRRPLALYLIDLPTEHSETFTATFQKGRGKITFGHQGLVLPESVTISDHC